MFISLYLLTLHKKTVGVCHFNGEHISGSLDLIIQPPFDLSALDNFSNFLCCNKNCQMRAKKMLLGWYDAAFCLSQETDQTLL